MDLTVKHNMIFEVFFQNVNPESRPWATNSHMLERLHMFCGLDVLCLQSRTKDAELGCVRNLKIIPEIERYLTFRNLTPFMSVRRVFIPSNIFGSVVS